MLLSEEEKIDYREGCGDGGDHTLSGYNSSLNGYEDVCFKIISLNIVMITKLSFNKMIHSINNSKFFAGLVMIMLNIGSKYITIKLSKSQLAYLEGTIARQILIFSIIWMGTRDLLISLGMTAVFVVLTDHLFNEKSDYCVLPYHLRSYEDAVGEEDKVTPEEIKNAKEVLERARKKELKMNHLRQIENFKSRFVY